MAIVRVAKRDTPYVVIDKTGLNDVRLSFKAKGLLAYLLSLPDGWNVNIADLSKRSSDGKDSVAAGLQELASHGYAEQHQGRDEGRFTKGSWTIYEVPVADSTVSGETAAGNTVAGKSGHGKSATTKEPQTEQPQTEQTLVPSAAPTSTSAAEESKKKTPAAYPEWFERLWALYPKMVKDRSNPKRGAFLKASGWLKKGYTEQDLIDAAAGYAASRPNPQFVQMGQTFYGPSAAFEQFIERGRGVDSTRRAGDSSAPPKARRAIQPEELLDDAGLF